MKKLAVFWVCALVVFSGFFVLISYSDEKGTARAYTQSTPIVVNSDADLLIYAGYGSGSQDDPFVIEGFEISDNYSFCVYVGNVTSYFVIRNCYFSNANSSYASDNDPPYSSGNAITFYNVTHGTIENNIIVSNEDCGIFLYASSNNRIENNNISSNNKGVSILANSHNNYIVNNSITDNNLGMELGTYDCTYHKIYGNLFINNTQHARDYGDQNYWNATYPTGGNYWDDYNGTDQYSGPNQDIPGPDGIGDTPYTNIEGATDYYPLMSEEGVFTAHAPIRINSDSDFNQSNGIVGGNGTALDPWVIERYEINGTGQGYCIYIGNTTGYFLIRNCLLQDASGGDDSVFFSNAEIILYNVSNARISYNTIKNGKYSIYIYESTNVTLEGNTMDGSSIAIFGEKKEHWNSHNIYTNNTVDGDPLYYLKNENGGVISGSAGQIILANCTNITIANISLPYRIIGVEMGFSNNNIVENCTFNSNYMYGAYLYKSNSNKIVYSNFDSCGTGVYINRSDENYVAYNTLTQNNGWGMCVSNSTMNTIIWNEITRNTKDGLLISNSNYTYVINNNVSSNGMNSLHNGIHLFSSEHNRIENNSVSSNDGDGILLEYSSNFNIINNNTMAGHDGCAGLDVHKYSHNNTITNNTATDNNIGISVHGHHNLIAYNNCSYNTENNGHGIYIVGDNNTILNNTASSNVGMGILISSENNTVLYNVFSSNGVRGIELHGNKHSVSHNIINSNGEAGILLVSSSSRIENNTISNNKYAILFESARNITLRNNTMINGGIDMGQYFVYSESILDYIHDIDTSNTVNGKPVYYWKNRNGGAVPQAGQVILVNCTNIIVENQNISHASIGMKIIYSSNVTVKNSTVSSNIHGIEIHRSSYDVISNNTAFSNSDGIYVRGNRNLVENNTLGSNIDAGVLVVQSQNNTLRNNTLANNKYGIYLQYSTKNNRVYHNIFQNNTKNGRDDTGNNYWNATYPTGGNYWDDYNGTDQYSGPNQDIPGPDGIGDTPYTNIGGGKGATDYYPIIRAANSTDTEPPVADAGPDQFVYVGETVTFNGSNSTDNVGITNYTWSFYDNSTIFLYGMVVNYTFNNPGVYEVTLNVSDAAGNWDTDTMNVTVNETTNTSTPPYSYPIYGYVVDENNNSISGATVTAIVPGYGTTTNMTDTQGYFTVDLGNIPGYTPSPGDVVYINATYGGAYANHTLTVDGAPPQNGGTYVLYVDSEGPRFNEILTPPIQKPNTPMYVAVNISDPDGVANATTYYRLPGETNWTSVNMHIVTKADSNGTWRADIPPSPLYGECYYYVIAMDNSGHTSRLGNETSPLSFLVTDGAPTEDPYIVFGTVFENGVAVASANVKLTNTATNMSWNTVTDSAGNYQVNLANLPGGYSDGDLVEVTGYHGLYEGVASGIVNTSADVQTLRVDLSLKLKSHVVEGYVFWPGGWRPAVNVSVNVTNNNTGDWCVVFTDSSGYYSVDLANGTLYPCGYADGDTIWVNAVYETISGNGVGVVDTNQNKTEVNITLWGEHKVTGYVYYRGAPISGASVMVSNLDTGDSTTTFTNSTGAYVVYLSNASCFPNGFAPGDMIQLRATSGGNSSINQTALDLASNYTWLNVTLASGFQISLENGWNLISFPLLLSTNMTASDLAVLIGWDKVEVISTENATGGYTIYIPGWTDNNSADNFLIQNDLAYWVFVNTTNTITFTINGSVPTAGDARNVTLHTGWNMVGWTSLNTTTYASMFLDYVVGRQEYSAIMYWNAVTQQWSEAYITEFHIPHGTHDFYMEPGRGYFITTGPGWLTYSPPPG